MQIQKIKEVYKISNNNLSIIAEKISDNNNLNIKTFYGDKEFVFIGSKPETVKAIAELLLEASNLTNNPKLEKLEIKENKCSNCGSYYLVKKILENKHTIEYKCLDCRKIFYKLN